LVVWYAAYIHAFSMMPVSTIFAFYGRLSVYCGFTILSIKHKNGGTNRQLYRINMFNTTSRIDVNGYWLQEFIQEDLHIICQCLEQYTDYKRLNNKIRETCQLSLPIAQRTTKEYTKTRNHNDTAHMISPNLQGWSPPTYTNDTINSVFYSQYTAPGIGILYANPLV
jgi:hypothetical protein